MSSITKTHVIRIGNSRGVRIPKIWLEQLDLTDEVEMTIQKDRLVIRSAKQPRSGWEEQFIAMHENGDDRLIDDMPASSWDEEEWEW